MVTVHSLRRGAFAAHPVPAGALQVELKLAGRSVETRSATLEVGEERVFVFVPGR